MTNGFKALTMEVKSLKEDAGRIEKQMEEISKKIIHLNELFGMNTKWISSTFFHAYLFFYR